MKKLFALFLFLSLAASALAQTNPVDELVRSFMRSTHTPGVSVAVMRNGKVESVSSYGIANSEYQITVSPETSFQMASGSKIFTSALLFRLLEQKKIALDDPLAKYVADAPPAWSAITIRDLAAHISGLAAPDVDSNITSSEAVVKLAVKVAPEAKPGERANYGDFDYPILQYILEKVAGKTYAQLMQEEIFQPLGFHCTMYDDAEQHGPQRMSKIVPNRAEYYRWMKTDTDTFNQKREFLYTKWAYAAGGAYACASDIATFFAAIDSGKLFSRESLNSARTPPRLADGTHSSFGLGWVVGHYRGHAWMGHSGGPAFSDMMYFPEDHLAIVVLTNQQKLYPQLASLIADQLLPNPVDSASDNLPDDAPALTAKARQLLEGMATGNINPTLLTPTQRGDYLEDLKDFAPGWLGPLQPISRMTLVSDKSAGQTRTRRYRIFFGAHPQPVVFEYDQKGQIQSIDPRTD
jgi:CubicO group peptidase (beta-lactamase class C family)